MDLMAVQQWRMNIFFFILVFSFVAVWLIVNMLVVSAGLRVVRVIDGDTVVLSSGEKARLLGIDAPDMGAESSEKAAVALEKIVNGNRVWVEGDRYGKDQFGRRLIWLWVGCESKPEFKAADYMDKLYKANKGRQMERWVEENPPGCKRGILINEELIKMDLARVYFTEKEGEMKYGERLRRIEMEKL